MNREDLQKLPIEELKKIAMEKAQAPAQPDIESLRQMPIEDLRAMAMQKAAMVAPDQSSIGDQARTFAESAGQALTLGYVPQIKAGIAEGVEEIGDFFTGDQTPDESYTQRRDRYIKELKDLQAQNPEASTAGTVTGTLASLFVPGGAAAKGAGALSKIGRAGAIGAGMGFLANPEDVEGEVGLQLKERLKGGLKGGATGAVLGGAIEGASKIVRGLRNSPKVLEGRALERAIESLGPSKTKMTNLSARPGRIDQMGKILLDEKVVDIGDDFASIAQKAQGKVDEVGREIGDLYSQSDRILAEVSTQGLPLDKIKKLGSTRINSEQLADSLVREVNKSMKNLAGSGQIRRAVKRVADDIRGGSTNKSLSETLDLRKSVDEMINFSRRNAELKGVEEVLYNFRTKLNDKIEQRLGVIDDVIGTKGAPEKLKELNKRYSVFKEAADIAKDAADGAKKNRSFSLTDYLTGGAIGGVFGSLPGMIAGAVINKAARKYGRAGSAKAMMKVAEILKNNPTALGRYSQVLTDAASKNTDEFIKAFIKLQKSDPEFYLKLKEP